MHDSHGLRFPDLLGITGYMFSAYIAVSAVGLFGNSLRAQSLSLVPSSTPVFGSAALVADPMSRMDALVDVNLDGKMDAIGFWTSRADRTKGELRSMVSDGKGGLTVHTLLKDVDIPANLPHADVVLGDWDGDGHRDFALYELGGQATFYHARVGGPVFAKAVSLAATPTVQNVVAADFNDDSRDDLAVVTATHFRIYLNSAVVPDTLGFEAAQGGTTLRLIDVDDDDETDVMFVIGGNEAALLKVHRKRGWTGLRQDTVTQHARFALGNTHPTMLACGDLDSDGDEDAVVFLTTRKYRILRHGAGGVFTAEPWRDGGPATALADIDGDGDLDGICCGSGGGGPYSGAENNIVVRFEIAINRGGGDFAFAFGAQNVGARHVAGAADMNGDGHVDLVAGRGILFNRHGTWSELDRRITPPFMAFVNVDRVTDQDGDGDFDVHTPFLGQGYRNPGDGLLEWAPPNLPKPPANTFFSTTAYYRGDWDGDGDEDILMGATGPTSLTTGLHLLRNDDGVNYVDAGLVSPKGDSFHPHYRTRIFAADYFAEDLDNDGLTDIITYWGSTTPTRAFLNQGGGQFKEIQHGLYTTLAFMEDLNQDGYPDLVAKSFNGNIDIYWGNQSGVPGTPSRLNTGTPIGAFAIADEDGDGDLDVYASIGKDIVFLRNQGNSFFSKHVLVSRDSSVATDLHLIDLDGDGLRDLFVRPGSHSASAWIATRTAAGSYAVIEQILINHTFAPVDADGDGDVDLIGDSVHYNLTHHGASRGVARQFGVATTGTNGVQPLLSATGPFRPGEDSALILRNGIGQSFALVVAGTSEVNLVDFPWNNVNTYTWPQPFQAVVQLDGVAGVPATGSWTASVRLPNGVANSTIIYHAYLADPTAPLGIISSNGVRVRYGN